MVLRPGCQVPQLEKKPVGKHLNHSASGCFDLTVQYCILFVRPTFITFPRLTPAPAHYCELALCGSSPSQYSLPPRRIRAFTRLFTTPHQPGDPIERQPSTNLLAVTNLPQQSDIPHAQSVGQRSPRAQARRNGRFRSTCLRQHEVFLPALVHPRRLYIC